MGRFLVFIILYSFGSVILGNWIGDSKIPCSSLEEMEEDLTGQEKFIFLQFVRKILQWVPEERMSAFNLLNDPWFNT
jgi:serine/threonine-protein kinase SRPK3